MSTAIAMITPPSTHRVPIMRVVLLGPSAVNRGSIRSSVRVVIVMCGRLKVGRTVKSAAIKGSRPRRGLAVRCELAGEDPGERGRQVRSHHRYGDIDDGDVEDDHEVARTAGSGQRLARCTAPTCRSDSVYRLASLLAHCR